ncbi:hypothetical protein ACGFX8_35475 [Streptomyces sp. NPDC048362]|uniref:hypothetical protein n=1 Tax=Streptomyces sp. NPDC048362 TaxID=3365539 RepID=UPI00372490DD
MQMKLPVRTPEKSRTLGRKMQMALRKRLVMAAVAAAVVTGGITAPAALAAPSAAHGSVQVAPAQGAELDNLRWTPVRTISGGVTWMLRVDNDPEVTAGEVYFLYNPDTESIAGKFSVGDDVLVSTVRTWQAAIFAPDLSVRRTEVRYGNPQDPGAAKYIASVTNGWIGG